MSNIDNLGGSIYHVTQPSLKKPSGRLRWLRIRKGINWVDDVRLQQEWVDILTFDNPEWQDVPTEIVEE